MAAPWGAGAGLAGTARQVHALQELVACAVCVLTLKWYPVFMGLISHSFLLFSVQLSSLGCVCDAAAVQNLGEKPILWRKAGCFTGSFSKSSQRFVFFCLSDVVWMRKEAIQCR